MCRTHTRRWTHLPERKETRLPLIRTEGITRDLHKTWSLSVHCSSSCLGCPSSTKSLLFFSFNRYSRKTGIHVHAFHASVLITSRCFITLDLSKFTVHYPHDTRTEWEGRINAIIRVVSNIPWDPAIYLPLQLLSLSFFLIYFILILFSFSILIRNQTTRRGKEIADISQVL